MNFSLSTWRLILSSPGPGAWNMAVDEAIAQAAGSGSSPPTLRMYSWEPPCLSLGFAQPVADADMAALDRLGWDLVRRPTGGRAILHTDELTYSITAPQDEPRLAGGVLESYRSVAGALLRGLHSMGIPAESLERHDNLQSSNEEESSTQNPVCFEVPSQYEITIHGKKLIGSAQARRQGWILQHGTLPLYGDLTRILQTLAFTDQEERLKSISSLLARATTVEAVLGATAAFDVAAKAIARSFEEALNIELDLNDLTNDELERAEQLVEEKYGNEEWTRRM